ncbi:MAG: glucosidase [Planctomycetota bacterium]|nr:glucosidase [Planctomycetota bacterium]MDA1106710.1 glucosidase [Planctomycetota bacterium]
MPHTNEPNAEEARLQQVRADNRAWRRWGPFVSCRQWGTVREDYSQDGRAWAYLSHDQARSRAYRWGEDGIFGWCDKDQRLCFSIALWNGRDAILKERFFGLTNAEGNHGEDVKELWWHVDALPSHAWNRMLYLYPQAEFPYSRLVTESHRRTRADGEFEITDTGVFEENRFFEVWVTYAKREADETAVRIEVVNRGPDAATLHLLPQLWFRNSWSWGEGANRPSIAKRGGTTLVTQHESLPPMELRIGERGTTWLFTENDTNEPRLFGTPARAEGTPGFKDAFHDRVVHSLEAACNPTPSGTKAAAWLTLELKSGERRAVDLVLVPAASTLTPSDVPSLMDLRSKEADEFWHQQHAGVTTADARRVQRQAYAGLLLSKQYYEYDIRTWLDGDSAQPPPPASRLTGRNASWRHLSASSVLTMPDTWEYPWFAAWDFALQCVAIAPVDSDFAKYQLTKLLTDHYMHPEGALPAYEWAFGDANPPIHAWAVWRTFQIDRARHRGGRAGAGADPGGDYEFLASAFSRLLINFTWWVNRKDSQGKNLFEGGFLGLDNVGVFDRSKPIPGGGSLVQADGTSWMAMYALTMMRMAIELATVRPFFQDLAAKFFEHFLQIAEAMAKLGQGDDQSGLWNEQDGFYYDLLRHPDGSMQPLRIESIVGLIPLFAVETIEPETLAKLPMFRERMEWFLRNRPEMAAQVSRWTEPGRGDRRLLSLLRGHRIKCLLRKALDETRFLSPHGVRSLSRVHVEHPFELDVAGIRSTVHYEPAESRTGLFGGNSNWRGPVWMPMNFLLIESLRKFHHYYGDDFKVECPAGSGTQLTLAQVADELVRRVSTLFLAAGEDGRGARPSMPHSMWPGYANDPTLRNLINFYEYFDGDTGRGCGASHQTGWTGAIGKLLTPPGSFDGSR